MKSGFHLLLQGVIFSFVLTGCYYDSKEYLNPELPSACDTSNYTFSGAVKHVLQSNCLSCHSNASAALMGNNIRLEEHADIAKEVNSGRLMGSIKHEPGFVPMPYNGGSLSTCNIKIIQKWIDSNAPNN